MTNKSNKIDVPQFFWPECVKAKGSEGRSNCTLFLDHPELLDGWDLRTPDFPPNYEVPAYLRREKVVAL